MSFFINRREEDAMIFKNFKKSGTCLFAFFLSVSLPFVCCAESRKACLTEPVTVTSIIRQPEGYSSDGQHLVTKLTDPATTMYAIPDPARPTEPVTAKHRRARATEPVTVTSIIRQPEGYSSDGQHLVTKLTDPATTMYAIPEPVRPSAEPVTTTSRMR